MNEMEERIVQCPYCGEMITVLIDCSIPEQQYIEDCQVCCQPINFKVEIQDAGGILISAKSEND